MTVNFVTFLLPQLWLLLKFVRQKMHELKYMFSVQCCFDLSFRRAAEEDEMSVIPKKKKKMHLGNLEFLTLEECYVRAGVPLPLLCDTHPARRLME